MAETIGQYGKIHTEPWTEDKANPPDPKWSARISAVARSAAWSEGVSAGDLLATVDRALKHGNLTIDQWFNARLAVSRGIGQMKTA